AVDLDVDQPEEEAVDEPGDEGGVVHAEGSLSAASAARATSPTMESSRVPGEDVARPPLCVQRAITAAAARRTFLGSTGRNLQRRRRSPRTVPCAATRPKSPSAVVA